MTPDPITKAREALTKAHVSVSGPNFVPVHYTIPAEALSAITAALDYATGLSVAHEECLTEIKRLEAENEKLKADADPEALVIAHMHGAQMATEKHREEIAKLKAERDAWKETADAREALIIRRTADRDRLTSQLEQAERVIAPFAKCGDEWKAYPCVDLELNVQSPCVSWPAAMTSDSLIAASQWIKDRQAKTGEG